MLSYCTCLSPKDYTAWAPVVLCLTYSKSVCPHTCLQIKKIIFSKQEDRTHALAFNDMEQWMRRREGNFLSTRYLPFNSTFRLFLVGSLQISIPFMYCEVIYPAAHIHFHSLLGTRSTMWYLWGSKKAAHVQRHKTTGTVIRSGIVSPRGDVMPR